MSISLGARVRVVGTLRAVGGLRTAFPRFAIELRSGPRKLQIKKLSIVPSVSN
jgi:hypothetical protein